MNHVSNVHMIPEWTRMSDLWHLQDHTYAVCRPPSPAVVIPFDIEDISCNTTVVTSSNVSQDVWEGSITRCICGFSHDDGFMICCDQCSVWQHVDCMGISRSAIPDEYLCEYCDPRPVDVPSAIRIQTKARKRLHSQGVNSDVSNSSGDESSEQVRQPQPTVKKPVSRVNTRLVEPTKTIRQEAPAINTVTSSRTFIVDKAAKSRVVDGELESAPLQTPVRRRRLSSVRASVELSDTSRHSTGTASNSEDELCIPAQKLSREEKKIQACMKMFEKMEKSRARHKDSVQDTNKPVKSTQKPTVKPGDDSCTDTSKRDVAVAKTVVNAEDDKNLNCAIEGRVDKKNTTAAAISRDETVANLLSVVDVDSDLDSIPIQQRLDRQRRCAVADDVKPSVCELDKFDSNLCKSSGFTEVLKREISDSCSEPVLATPLSNADRSTIAALQKTATIKLTEDILATDVKSEKFFDCKAGILEEKSKGENFVDSPLCCVVAGTGSTVMKAESLDANIGEHTTVKMVKGKTIKKSKDEMLSSEDEESSVSGAKLVSPNRSKTVTDGTENRTVLSGKVGSANEGDNTDAPSTKSAEPAAAELEGVDSDGCGCDLPLKSEEDKAAADDCQPNSSTASSSVKCKRLAGDSKTRALQRLKRLSPHTSSPRMSTRMSTRLSIAAAATTASTSSTFDKASFYLKRPPQRTKPLFTSVSPLIVLSPLRHTAGSRYSDSSQGHAFAKKRWLMQAISETTSSSASDSNVKVSHSDGELAPANFLSPSGSGMSTPLKKRRLTLESTDAAGSEGFSSPEYPHPGSSMSLRTPLSETLRAYSNLFERISTERQSTGESPNQSSAGLQSQAVTSTGSDSPGTSDNGRRGAGDGTASVDSTTTDGEESAETSSKSQQAAAACRSSHLTPRKRYMRMEVEQWERQDRDDSTDSKTAVDSTLECNEISSTDSASVGGFKSPPTDQQPSMLRGQSWLEDGSLMGNVVTSAALKCDLDGAENLQPNALPPPSSVDQSVGQPLPVFGEPTISPPCGIDDSGNRVEPGQDRRRLSSKDQGDDVMSPLLLEGETMSSAEPSRSFGIADESVSAQAVKRKMSLAEYRTRHHLDSSSSNKSCTVTQPTMPVHRPVTPPVETVADITVFSSLSDSPGPSEIRHIGKRWNLAATAAEQMLSLTDRLRFEFGVDAADDSIGSTESDVLADVPTEVTCSTPSAPLGVISSPKQSSSSSSWAVAMTSSSLSSAVPVLLASERRSSQYRSPTVLESSRLQPAPLRTNARSQLSPVSPQLPFHSPPLPPHLLSPPPQSLSSAERLRLHPSEQTESCRQLSQAARQVSHQQSEELVPDQPLRLALNRMSTPHQQPSALPRSPSPQNSTELSQKETISRWSSAFSRQPPDFPLSVPRLAPALQQQAPPFLPRSPPQKPAELSPDSVTVPHMSSAFTRQRVPALAEELQLFGPRSPTLQQPSAVDSFLESRSATLKLPSTHPANLQPSLPQKQQLSHPSQQPLLRLTPPPVSPPKSINEFKAANDDYRRKAASQQTFVQAKSKTLLHVEPLPSQHQQGSSLEPAVGSRQPALSRPELYNQRATTHPLAMKPIEAQRTDLAPKPDTIETTSPGSTLLQRLPPRPVLSAPLAQELKNSQSKPPRLPSVGLSTQPETTFIGGVAAAPGLLPPAVQPPHQPFPVEQLNPQTAQPRLMLPSPLSVPRPREPIASPATPVGGPWMGIRPPLPSPPSVPVPMAMTLPPPLLPPLELVDVTRPPPPLPFQTAVGVPVYHGEHPVPVFRPPDLPREPLVPPPFPPSLGLPVAPPLPPPLPQDSTESEMLPPPLPPSPPPASPPEPADSSARSRAHRLASRRAEKKLRRKLRKREQTDVTPPAFSSSSQRDGSKSHLSDGSVWHSCRQWSENIDDQKREDDDVAGSNSGGQYNVNTSAVRRSSQHEIEGDKGLLNESSRTRRAVGDQFAADQRRPWNQTVHRKTVDGVDSHCNDRGGSGLSGRVQLHNDDGRHSIESRDRSSVNVDQTPGCGRRGDMWLSRADTRRMERDGGEEHWQPARLTSAGRFDRVSDGNADRDESNETDESGGDTAAGGHPYMAGHRKHAGQLCSSSNAPSERRPVDKSGNPTVPSLMNNHRRPVSGHRSHVAGPRGFFQPRSSPTSRSGFSGPRVVRPLMSLSATPTRPGIGGAQLSARSHRESPLPQTTTRISSPDAGRDVSSSSSSEHCKVTSCNEFESELREDCMYGAPPPRRRGEFSSGGRLHTNRGLREGGVSGFDRY